MNIFEEAKELAEMIKSRETLCYDYNQNVDKQADLVLDLISESETEKDNCISKQAAQNKIKKICNKYGLSYEDGERKPATGGSAYALGHAFDDLPPIIPQQEIGQWIEMDTNMYTCSKCSHCFTLVPEDNHISQFKYCPNCRTKMEVEK